MVNSPMLSTPSLRPDSVAGTDAPVTQRPSRLASRRILNPLALLHQSFILLSACPDMQGSSVVMVFLGLQSRNQIDLRGGPQRKWSHPGRGAMFIDQRRTKLRHSVRSAMLIPSITRALSRSIDIALLTECGSFQSPVRYKHCTPGGVRSIG